MQRTDPTSRRFGWSSLLAMQLVIPVGLTLLMYEPTWSLRTWVETLGVNLVFTVAISGAAVLIFDVALARLRWSGAPKLVMHVLGFALSIAVGMQLAMSVLGTFGVAEEVDGGSAWRTAMIVTLLALGVGFTFDRLQARARAVELRAEQVRRELVQAQLEVLRERLNPHFLFNSLNALAGLIEEDPPRAVEALERLSGLLRRSLERGTTPKIPLGEETAALRDYFAIGQLRFGERLRWSVDVDVTLLRALVPALLLQPVVENSIKYAVAPRRSGASVRMAARRVGERLQIEVCDDGPGVAGDSGMKIGHRMLRERLALEYGERASLVAGSLEGGGYRVLIELPWEVGAT